MSEPRVPSHGPTSTAVKLIDPAIRALIDDAVAKKQIAPGTSRE
jgi:hypothetical protein